MAFLWVTVRGRASKSGQQKTMPPPGPLPRACVLVSLVLCGCALLFALVVAVGRSWASASFAASTAGRVTGPYSLQQQSTSAPSARAVTGGSVAVADGLRTRAPASSSSLPPGPLPQWAVPYAKQSRFVASPHSWPPSRTPGLLGLDAIIKRYGELTAAEWAKLDTHGFVVSNRLGANSFGRALWEAYSAHLPVYVSADAILHAWHRSFDAMVEEIEQRHLRRHLDRLLDAMLLGLAATLRPVTASESPDRVQALDALVPSGRRDVSAFLHVAKRLLNTDTPAPVPDPNAAAVTDRIVDALTHIRQPPVTLFAHSQGLLSDDSSMYQPRGHYTKTPQLRAYFQAMTWLARTQLPVSGPRTGVSLPAMGCAVLLALSVRNGPATAIGSGPAESALQRLNHFEALITALVGVPDIGTLSQMDSLQPPIQTAADITADSLQRLAAAVERSPYGLQAVNDRPRLAMEVEPAARTGRTYALMGARCAVDAWAQTQVVSVSGKTDAYRRIPSALDVAFAVFGNDAVAPTIAQLMSGAAPHPVPHGFAQQPMPFRDGHEYGAQLVSVRARTDTFATPDDAADAVGDHTEAAEQRPPLPLPLPTVAGDRWDSSVYTLWLHALRQLSNADQQHDTVLKGWRDPTGHTTTGVSDASADAVPSEHDDDDAFEQRLHPHTVAPAAASAPVDVRLQMPEFARTHAFGLATANTQLGSWTELRHDTILYVKQGFGMVPGCGYPAGYVDPRIGFWRALRRMVQRMRSVLRAHLPAFGTAFLELFAGHVATLESISAAQHQSKPLTPQQTKFLRELVVQRSERCGSGSCTRYSGWYPALFRGRRVETFLDDEYIVADTFTDPAADELGDPGCVQHMATGGVALMVVAVETPARAATTTSAESAPADVGDAPCEGNAPVRQLYVGPVYTRYEFCQPPGTRLTDEQWQVKLKSGAADVPLTAEQAVYRVVEHPIPGVKV